ncbi:hypothetical protein FA95DRAFT_645698 [Auriscalpium vulgare]|uniref:Uncharacterized protein n=1 Tax=Auriscalpium vulgare TaxID=40419 RepID=A0ACB8S2J9_9AGAM|nr:hypothetical protein FA95DRAFT_645698 [Auriscalpium vulgare]
MTDPAASCGPRFDLSKCRFVQNVTRVCPACTCLHYLRIPQSGSVLRLSTRGNYSFFSMRYLLAPLLACPLPLSLLGTFYTAILLLGKSNSFLAVAKWCSRLWSPLWCQAVLRRTQSVGVGPAYQAPCPGPLRCLATSHSFPLITVVYCGLSPYNSNFPTAATHPSHITPLLFRSISSSPSPATQHKRPPHLHPTPRSSPHRTACLLDPP